MLQASPKKINKKKGRIYIGQAGNRTQVYWAAQQRASHWTGSMLVYLFSSNGTKRTTQILTDQTEF